MAKRAKSEAYVEYEILRELMGNIDLADLKEQMVTGNNETEIENAGKRWDKVCAKLLKWMKKRQDSRGRELGLND